MFRPMFHRLLGLIILFSVAVFLTACAASSHFSGSGSGSGAGSGAGSGSGSGSSGGSGGSGGAAPGGFAAGIGGDGQTSAAQFLVAVQIPGSTPIPTRIGSDGTLTAAKVSMPPFPPNLNPMAMNAAIDPSGTYFYEAVQPGIWGFTINRQTGDLTEMPNMPLASSQNFDAVVIDQLGKFLYAYGGGQVFAYTIQAGTGQLSPVPGSPFGAAPSGQQFAIASDRMAVSQNDNFLYVATGSGIMAYTIDQTTGALTMVSGSPFGGSAGSAFAIVAPSSGFLYETVQQTGTTTFPIFGYSIDQTTGALSPISGSPFAPGCGADNLTSPVSGKFLFAAGCGMYQINTSTGALTQLFKDPSTPNSIWAVFDPTGNFVWMVTTDQNCWHCDIGVTAFQVDGTTGAMTMVPNSFFIMQNDMTGGIQSLAITH